MRVGPPLPHGSVIFCDDIRDEVGGKRSLMGIYDAEMRFSEPSPAALPTFCALISWKWDSSDPPEHIKFVMFQDIGESSVELFAAEVVVPPEVIGEAAINLTDPEAPRVGQMQCVAKFANFTIESSCILKIRAFVGEDEHRIGALRVAFSSSDRTGE